MKRKIWKITKQHKKGCRGLAGPSRFQWFFDGDTRWVGKRRRHVLVAMCNDPECDAEAEVDSFAVAPAVGLPRGHVRRKP